MKTKKHSTKIAPIFIGLTLISLLGISAVLISTNPKPETPSVDLAKDQMAKLALPFVQNIGQTSDDILYYSHLQNGTVFINNDGSFIYKFFGEDDKTIAFKEKFAAGVTTNFVAQGKNPTNTSVNYLKGNDPSKWRSNVPNYETVDLGTIAQNINLTVKAYGKNFEKIFTIQPQGNLDDLQITLEKIKK